VPGGIEDRCRNRGSCEQQSRAEQMDTLPELKAFNYRQGDAIHSCYILSGDQNLLGGSIHVPKRTPRMQAEI
jgi:hypothetical protein